MKDFHFIDSASPQDVEDLYKQYQENPGSIDPGWRSFFQGFDYASIPDTPEPSPYVDFVTGPAGKNSSASASDENSKLRDLIYSYRSRGHFAAQINPLSPSDTLRDRAELSVEDHGFVAGDLAKDFSDSSKMGLGNASLKNIVKGLEETYCSSLGVEYKHIRDGILVDWLEDRMEKNKNRHQVSSEDKKHILNDLVRGESFESFLHLKYVGAKRFSLEGGTSLIPALESMLDYGGELGAEEFVIGMAHRGRLNVLANVLRKNYEAIFTEFEGADLPDGVEGDGDVKYHMGFSADRKTSSGKTVHVSLCPNPSHLEFIDPVLVGMTRGKQEFRYGNDAKKCVPVAIHGDAAVAGQGVVYETINLCHLDGFSTGGTIHIVINNQVGFTTRPSDSRSTMYCTDVFKMLETPIIHVNGDDAEAVVHAMHMAIEIRQEFGRDVVIDLYCYRKYGHNESDEPRFTQPKMYALIDKHPSPANIYAKDLLEQKVINDSYLKEKETEFKKDLDQRLEETRSNSSKEIDVNYLKADWANVRVAKDADFDESPMTGANREGLQLAADAIAGNLKEFPWVKKLGRLLKDRKKIAAGEKMIDWGFGENLAYASLLLEGHPVRLSGQDVRRGTFTHRHAVWTNDETEERYVPINHLKEGQAQADLFDSSLSESGVLGFEFGYAMANPKGLTIWEAQFGDFANGAQVIIDQFISSSESKWQRMTGLVMLLPHGYEGQGPEHSSARLERFLQMCAENNMQVANVTNPAQLFHILRRQVKRDFRKPLIIMSPKSLLRHPKIVCGMEHLTEGRFHEILPDTLETSSVERLAICSGKIFLDLESKREDLSTKKVGIVRLEQLYPFPEKQMKALLSNYSVNVDIVWTQEEPENMGAWHFVRDKFLKMGREIRVVSRKESASPATGNPKVHQNEQDKIINTVFEGMES
ncbi:MAG: 2-oxoglutarate dehydrogenase E1 component [Bdellovibrionales bacterium]